MMGEVESKNNGSSDSLNSNILLCGMEYSHIAL